MIVNCPSCQGQIEIPRNTAPQPPKVRVRTTMPPLPGIPEKPSRRYKAQMKHPLTYVGVAGVCAIVVLVGLYAHRTAAVKHRYISAFEEILRDANRVSIATERGITKREFVDAYESVKYDWQRKRKQIDRSNSKFDAIASDIDDAIRAWDAATYAWEVKEAWPNASSSAISLAVQYLGNALGTSNLSQLQKAAETEGSNLFAPNNMASLISACFAKASLSLADAERHMNELR